MAKKNKSKNNSSQLWKPVEITGIFNNGVSEFEGFAGLEILENYDSKKFLKGNTKQKGINISELEGESYDNRKRKSADAVNVDDVENPTQKKSKNKSDEKNFPGRFVLLKPPEEVDTEEAEEEDEIFETSGASEIRNTWNQIGVTSNEIIKSLIEKGFKEPTEIQRSTISVSAYGKCDILGAAPTGSGKTLAFGLPIVQNIQKILQEDEGKSENMFALILTPTRELAQQIEKHLREISKYTDVKLACIIGGLAAVKQERILRSNPHIVIGTPGRIWELVQDGNQHLQKIRDIRFLVVDETDRMVEKGHFTELEEILNLLNREEDAGEHNENRNPRQNFVFSATLTLVHELPQYLKKKRRQQQKPIEMTKDKKLNELIEMFGMKSPKIFDLSNKGGVAEKVVEARILCSMDEKDFYLYYILTSHQGRTIIFCNSIECVKRLSSVLSHLNVTSVFLHGKMEQKQRLRNLELFQKHEDVILVATQVAARGLDIPNVQHVIHYQVPTTGEDYIHRSGRTARADKEGLSILLMEPSEVKFFVKLQKTLGRNEDLPIFPIDQMVMRGIRERVRMAREIENLDLQVRRQNDGKNWRKRASDDVGMMDESDNDSEEESRQNHARKQIDKILKQKKFALGKLLSSKIVFPSSIPSLKFPVNEEGKIPIQRTSFEFVKNFVNEQKSTKGKKIKLFRAKDKK